MSLHEWRCVGDLLMLHIHHERIIDLQASSLKFEVSMAVLNPGLDALIHIRS